MDIKTKVLVHMFMYDNLGTIDYMIGHLHVRRRSLTRVINQLLEADLIKDVTPEWIEEIHYGLTEKGKEYLNELALSRYRMGRRGRPLKREIGVSLSTNHYGQIVNVEIFSDDKLDYVLFYLLFEKFQFSKDKGVGYTNGRYQLRVKLIKKRGTEK